MYPTRDIVSVMKGARQIDLAEQLRAAMNSSGMSMFMISKKAGIGYAAIHGFTNGTRDLTLGSVTRIARVLDLELRPRKRKGMK